MILLPQFRDQHDNAQRMAELGYGVRLDLYRFTDAQLHGAIDRLWATPTCGTHSPTSARRSTRATGCTQPRT
ncbi:hypothetical protein ACFU0X_21140 [Streptomyces cellulosae]|uniref:Uncharacterized protein n=1 Tax=Streptomyces cellulosae TaxID=1968 RepID=A0ABW6JKK0_STRCE